MDQGQYSSSPQELLINNPQLHNQVSILTISEAPPSVMDPPRTPYYQQPCIGAPFTTDTQRTVDEAAVVVYNNVTPNYQQPPPPLLSPEGNFKPLEECAPIPSSTNPASWSNLDAIAEFVPRVQQQNETRPKVNDPQVVAESWRRAQYRDSSPPRRSSRGSKDEPTPLLQFTEMEEGLDLFTAPEHFSLAHCVAADFGMSLGIATLFKERFGRVDELRSTRSGIGDVAVLRDGDRYIFYLVTKERSCQNPFLKDLLKSIKELRRQCEELGVRHLAIPRLGCGLDKLDWREVRENLQVIFKDSDLEIQVYYIPYVPSDSRHSSQDHDGEYSRGTRDPVTEEDFSPNDPTSKETSAQDRRGKKIDRSKNAGPRSPRGASSDSSKSSVKRTESLKGRRDTRAAGGSRRERTNSATLHDENKEQDELRIKKSYSFSRRNKSKSEARGAKTDENENALPRDEKENKSKRNEYERRNHEGKKLWHGTEENEDASSSPTPAGTSKDGKRPRKSSENASSAAREASMQNKQNKDGKNKPSSSDCSESTSNKSSTLPVLTKPQSSQPPPAVAPAPPGPISYASVLRSKSNGE